MAVPESAETIKGWFATGDQPTEAQCAAEIDTYFHWLEKAVDDIDEAEPLYAAIQPDLLLIASHSLSMKPTFPQLVVYQAVLNGATIQREWVIISGDLYMYIRITFAVPFPDANYYLRTQNCSVNGKTASFILLQVQNNRPFSAKVYGPS